MTEEQMIQTALEAGFTYAVFMDVKHLVFNPELRKYCEENVCGNYGKNHSCPPDCGTPEEMEKRAGQYDRALILETVNQIQDISDGMEIKKVRKIHNEISQKFMDQMQAEGENGLRMMAGPCAVCEKCANSCRFPEKLASCLSAYCIEAEKMAKYCELPYWCGENKVAFFSLYLINSREKKTEEERC